MAKIKEEVYWYSKKDPKKITLQEDAAADVCVVGGGMAGLSAAQILSESGRKVIIVESSFCGGGASGKSSGFLTPDSELQLADLLNKYGKKGAKELREFVNGGLELIKNNIEKYKIECDYQIQDSFFVANSKKSFKEVEDEHHARKDLGYDSQLYGKSEMKEALNSSQYFGAVRYGECFGLNSFLYCQGMKDVLLERGLKIFEDTKVSEIREGSIVTEGGLVVRAENLIIATDRFLPSLDIQKPNIYHAQTFLAVSAPLSEAVIKTIFPNKHLMVWDTDLIYQYFRTIENNRLLMGASTLIETYMKERAMDFSSIIEKMKEYLNKKFNSKMEFEYVWPGLIGVTKDLFPIAGEDPALKKVYYMGGATGLPWAAALGAYLADKILNNRNDLDHYFRPSRKFPVSNNAQIILSKPLSFAVSHGIVKYF